MPTLKEILQTKIPVQNVTQDSDNSDVWIEYYFKTKYHSIPFSSMKCPSCGETMYRKKDFPSVEDNHIMVGGHVKLLHASYDEYILPICNLCNKKRGNLAPFHVEFDKLCPIPKE
nr:hypothetical protein [Bacteroides intestinalis]